MNLDLNFTSFKKSSEWIIDLNVKHKRIKLLEKYREGNLRDLCLGKESSSKVRSIKVKVDKVDLINIKTFAL